jgi:hypothetical protein
VFSSKVVRAHICVRTAHVGDLVPNFGDILRYDVIVKNSVSWDVMPCLVERYRRFGVNLTPTPDGRRVA